MTPKVASMVMLACMLLATPYAEALTPGNSIPSKCEGNAGYPINLPFDCSNNSTSSSSSTSTSTSVSISSSTGNDDQLPAPNATLS